MTYRLKMWENLRPVVEGEQMAQKIKNEMTMPTLRLHGYRKSKSPAMWAGLGA
jgi:hypothetical protein